MCSAPLRVGKTELRTVKEELLASIIVLVVLAQEQWSRAREELTSCRLWPAELAFSKSTYDRLLPLFEPLNWMPPQDVDEPGVRVNRMRWVSVPSATSVPFTVMETPPATYTVVPGLIVSVRPAGTVRLAVMLYGPAAADHIVSAGKVPETLATLPSSYQMSMLVRAISTLLLLKACTSTRLSPG